MVRPFGCSCFWSAVAVDRSALFNYPVRAAIEMLFSRLIMMLIYYSALVRCTAAAKSCLTL